MPTRTNVVQTIEEILSGHGSVPRSLSPTPIGAARLELHAHRIAVLAVVGQPHSSVQSQRPPSDKERTLLRKVAALPQWHLLEIPQSWHSPPNIYAAPCGAQRHSTHSSWELQRKNHWFPRGARIITG